MVLRDGRSIDGFFIFAAPFLRPGTLRKGVIEGGVAVGIVKIRRKGGNNRMRKDVKIVIDGHAGRLVSAGAS